MTLRRGDRYSALTALFPDQGDLEHVDPQVVRGAKGGVQLLLRPDPPEQTGATAAGGHDVESLDGPTEPVPQASPNDELVLRGHTRVVAGGDVGAITPCG
jgi:hypothetical protein